jgi:type I restriction enzyme S subunit
MVLNGWQDCKLKDLATKIGSGATPTGGGSSYKTDGISLIRSQNVLDFSFALEGLAFIDDNQAHELRNVIVEENDVLLNITGDSVARVCKVPKKVLPARVNQHVAIIRANTAKLDSDFLLYFLQSFKQHLLSISEIGGTRRALTKGMIEDLDVRLPNLHQQKSIASILSSLDDKIDLLHRQNATLEAMAETLFRQWFVEEAKEEWEEKSLFDSIVLVGGGTPKTSVGEYWNGSISWLAGGDIAGSHKNFVVRSEKTITELGLQNSSARLLPQYSTVISARGTVGKYCILSEPMAFSQSNYGVEPRFNGCFFFSYLLIAHCVDELQSSAYGSVFDTITTSTFKETKVSLPKEETIRIFDKEVAPLFLKMKNNIVQIQTLSNLRDTVLPRLMNGDLRISK